MSRIIEDHYPLSVFHLKKIGFFNAGQELSGVITYANEFSIELRMYGGNSLQVLNVEGNTETITDTFIALDTSFCTLGGSRYWFLCPGKGVDSFCNNRVGKLYLSEGDFACRHCHKLTYRRQNLSSKKHSLFNESLILARQRKTLEEAIKRGVYRGRETKKVQKYRRVIERQNKVHDRIEVMLDLLRDKNLKLKSRKKQKNPYIREPKKSEGVGSEIAWSFPDSSEKISNWRTF